VGIAGGGGTRAVQLATSAWHAVDWATSVRWLSIQDTARQPAGRGEALCMGQGKHRERKLLLCRPTGMPSSACCITAMHPSSETSTPGTTVRLGRLPLLPPPSLPPAAASASSSGLLLRHRAATRQPRCCSCRQSCKAEWSCAHCCRLAGSDRQHQHQPQRQQAAAAGGGLAASSGGNARRV